MFLSSFAHESVVCLQAVYSCPRFEMKPALISLSRVQCANIPVMQCGLLGVTVLGKVYLYTVYTMDLPKVSNWFSAHRSHV